LCAAKLPPVFPQKITRCILRQPGRKYDTGINPNANEFRYCPLLEFIETNQTYNPAYREGQGQIGWPIP